MTLAQLQTFVRNIIFEPSGDTGLVDDTQLTAFINAANERIWTDCVAKKSSVFMVRAAGLNLSATTGLPYIGTGGVDVTNGVFRLTQLEQLVGSTYFTMEPTESPQDRFIYEPSFPPLPVHSRLLRYYIEGDVIYPTPVPNVDVTVRAVYVPGLVDMSGSTDKPLQGKLTNFHRLVAYEAACLIFGKDESAPTLIIQARDEQRKLLARHLASMTAFHQRGIHHVPYV